MPGCRGTGTRRARTYSEQVCVGFCSRHGQLLKVRHRIWPTYRRDRSNRWLTRVGHNLVQVVDVPPDKELVRDAEPMQDQPHGIVDGLWVFLTVVVAQGEIVGRLAARIQVAPRVPIAMPAVHVLDVGERSWIMSRHVQPSPSTHLVNIAVAVAVAAVATFALTLAISPPLIPGPRATMMTLRRFLQPMRLGALQQRRLGARLIFSWRPESDGEGGKIRHSRRVVSSSDSSVRRMRKKRELGPCCHALPSYGGAALLCYLRAGIVLAYRRRKSPRTIRARLALRTLCTLASATQSGNGRSIRERWSLATETSEQCAYLLLPTPTLAATRRCSLGTCLSRRPPLRLLLQSFGHNRRGCGANLTPDQHSRSTGAGGACVVRDPSISLYLQIRGRLHCRFICLCPVWGAGRERKKFMEMSKMVAVGLPGSEGGSQCFKADRDPLLAQQPGT
jgi:hypothetical protein